MKLLSIQSNGSDCQAERSECHSDKLQEAPGLLMQMEIYQELSKFLSLESVWVGGWVWGGGAGKEKSDSAK